MSARERDVVELNEAEQFVLDLVAARELSKGEPTPTEYVRLKAHAGPRGSEADEVVAALVKHDLLDQEVRWGSLRLTPWGLAQCESSAEVARFALALVAYLTRRIELEDVTFKLFTWANLKDAAVMTGDESFPFAARVIEILQLKGPGSAMWPGPPPGADWPSPEDKAAVKKLGSVDDLLRRADSLRRRPHRPDDVPPKEPRDTSEGTKYEPPSKLAEDVLMGRWFRPFSEGFVYAEGIVQVIDASEADVEGVLRGLEEGGLVSGTVHHGVRGAPRAPVYTSNILLWELRERVMHARGLRHPALMHQREHELAHLVLAVVAATYAENARTAGTYTHDTKRLIGELTIHLYAFSREEILACCHTLVNAGMLVETTKHRTSGPDENAFDLTARGQQECRTTVARALRLAEGQGILDAVVRDAIQIFDAWQSEYKPARNMIEAALADVVKAINTMGGLVHRLEIVQATAPGDGAIRIDVALQEKIRAADLFVGDLTPVYAYGDRLRVNENVLVEVGFALASKEANQVVLLAMQRDDVPGDATNAKPTFDIAHVRRHYFKTKDELRRKLRVELEATLRSRGWLR